MQSRAFGDSESAPRRPHRAMGTRLSAHFAFSRTPDRIPPGNAALVGLLAFKCVATGVMDEPMLRAWMTESVKPAAHHDTLPGPVGRGTLFVAATRNNAAAAVLDR